MNTLYWSIIGFLLGSMMFSLWLGRLVLDVDVRDFGDGNPGAGNAWRAGDALRAGGGWRVGVPAALLDYSKGAVPVALAHYSGGVSDWGLVPVGLAPFLGHYFSPFLRFRGGKGVAVTFGLWTGLTGLGGPLALGVTCGVLWALQRADGWTMFWGMAGLLAFLLFRVPAAPLFSVWMVNAALIVWRHRRELRDPMRLRSWHLPRTG